jgi:hypothetical protein
VGNLACLTADTYQRFAIYLGHRGQRYSRRTWAVPLNMCLPAAQYTSARWVPWKLLPAHMSHHGCLWAYWSALLSAYWTRKGKVNVSLYRPWRALGLREVEATTFSYIRLTDGNTIVSPMRRPHLPPGRFLVLISVGGWGCIGVLCPRGFVCRPPHTGYLLGTLLNSDNGVAKLVPPLQFHDVRVWYLHHALYWIKRDSRKISLPSPPSAWTRYTLSISRLFFNIVPTDIDAFVPRTEYKIQKTDKQTKHRKTTEYTETKKHETRENLLPRIEPGPSSL